MLMLMLMLMLMYSVFWFLKSFPLATTPTDTKPQVESSLCLFNADRRRRSLSLVLALVPRPLFWSYVLRFASSLYSTVTTFVVLLTPSQQSFTSS